MLHGQNRKSEEPPLALFAICTPFGPPSLLEIPQKEVMFKSKHKLDLALVSMDQRYTTSQMNLFSNTKTSKLSEVNCYWDTQILNWPTWADMIWFITMI